MTLTEAKARSSTVDWTAVHRTEEATIRQHMVEDGEDPDATAEWQALPSVASVRRRLGLTQSRFAALIQIPVATVRNWEQGRVVPDAAARTLLAILWREPEAALRALKAA